MNLPAPLSFLRVIASLLLCLCCLPSTGQGNGRQTLLLAGLSTTSAATGGIQAVAVGPAGDIYLLEDQGDGVRLRKLDNSGTTVEAQARLGAAGDSGTALALDAAGNVYVTGTTNSAGLAATAGAAVGARTDASTQSFVAGFDAALQTRFVTFTGGSRIVANAIAVSADAVFVTGITYSALLPATPGALQRAPAQGSVQHGFVERFSSDGRTLVYATYLTGAGGDTTPAAIAVDAQDNAYVAGSTAAPGFPTTAGALVPQRTGSPSGFVCRLTPAGYALVFATYVPGAGLTSAAIDGQAGRLLVSGTVEPGQFPVGAAAMFPAGLPLQVLVQMPLDGSAVLAATAVATGVSSHLAISPAGGAWVGGDLQFPLLPLAPLAGLGGAYAAYVNASGAVASTARLGGLPVANASYSSLTTSLPGVAVDANGVAVLGGTVTVAESASVQASQSYDLPLRSAPNAALPSQVADARASAGCAGSQCAGTAGYLARVDAGHSASALSLAADELPFVRVRNLGSATVTGLQVTATNATVATDCGTSLVAGAECSVLLSGGGAGTLSVAGTNGDAQTLAFAAYAAPATGLAVESRELDFGVHSAADSVAAARTITIVNLGAAAERFGSAIDGTGRVASPFTETASDCPNGGTTTTKLLAAGAACHVTLGFGASANGVATANWAIGARDVLLTAYGQAAALTLSATAIDFGTQYTGGARLPRYLTLSNPTSGAVAHTAVLSPAGSAFTVLDGCPATLATGTSCTLRIDYSAAVSPSSDSATLSLDQGAMVTLTGRTQDAPAVTGLAPNQALSVYPATVSFSGKTVVTGVSAATQTVTLTNNGSSAFALALSLTGDFTQQTNCGATLAAGQSCLVMLTFVPAQPGARGGLLAVTAGSGNAPTNVAIAATAAAIVPVVNGAVDLGSSLVGVPVTKFLKLPQAFATLTATAAGPYTLALVEETGFGPVAPPDSAFAPSLTAACRNCYLAVRFMPTGAGAQNSTLTLMTDARGMSYTAALTGTGIASVGLVLSPAAMDFGSVAVHSRGAATLFTVTNLAPGGAAVNVTAPVVNGDFTLVANPYGGQACGGTLANGDSCFFAVAFAPTAVGAATGAAGVNGTVGTTATLTGTGTVDPGIGLVPAAVVFTAAAPAQTVTVTNTGSTAVTLGAPATGSGAFAAASKCGALAPGASCSITVTFTPGAAQVSDTLTLPVSRVVAGGGTPQASTAQVALTGSYTNANPNLQVTPAQIQFGLVATGSTSAARVFTVTNLTAKAAGLTYAIPHNFVLTGTPCTTLPANGSCTFTVAALPLIAGDQTGTVTVTAAPVDGSAAFSAIAYVEVFGSGQGTLAVTGGLIVNGVFSFGQVQAGQSVTQAFSVTNTGAAGSAAVTVRRVVSAPPFLATTNCGVLAAGASCGVNVIYTPQNQGGTTAVVTESGRLTIESDAASSPGQLVLTGSAAASGTGGGLAPLATYTLSQGSLMFASTAVGNASPVQTVTLTNTGNVALHVSAVRATADFTVTNSCATVAAGASCNVGVTSTPQTNGQHAASLEIASDAAAVLDYVSLLSTATPAPLIVTPASLDFGSVTVGQRGSLNVQVTNVSGGGVVFHAITATTGYGVAGSCPAAGGTLPAGQSCTVQVTFAPTATGTMQGTLSIATGATTNPLTVTLAGVGVQSRLVIAPGSLAFGNITTGALTTQTITLTNSGTAAVTGLTLVVSPGYSVSTPCPAALAMGASCTAQVTFGPTAAGVTPGWLTVTSSDPASPVTVPLTGTGIVPASFTLSVDGSPTSSSATVISGQPATYKLTVTPVGSFAGTVALTCAALQAGPYASCSIMPASLTLGGSAQDSTVTINTITSAGLDQRGPLDGAPTVMVCGLVPLLSLAGGRRRLPRLLLAVVAAVLLAGAGGCGSGTTAVSNTRYTPAGSYQYQVTASSTSGMVLSRTVTLNLTVTGR